MMNVLFVNLTGLHEELPQETLGNVWSDLISHADTWDEIHLFAAMNTNHALIEMCEGRHFFPHIKPPKVYDDLREKRDTSIEIVVAAVETAQRNLADVFWFCGITDEYLYLVKYLSKIGKHIGLVLPQSESRNVCKDILPYTRYVIHAYKGEWTTWLTCHKLT